MGEAARAAEVTRQIATVFSTLWGENQCAQPAPLSGLITQRVGASFNVKKARTSLFIIHRFKEMGFVLSNRETLSTLSSAKANVVNSQKE